MRRKYLFLIACFVLVFLTGCANRDAAQLGSLIGRSLGKPIGAVVTAVDETFQTAGDVIQENPRYRKSQGKEQQLTPVVTGSRDGDFFYRAEVLVQTRGPAQIESLSLQKTEDVTAFWR